MRIHCLQHSPLGGETHLPAWAGVRGYEWVNVVVPEAAEPPGMADVECLVVMGGPMSAWEEERYPWLKTEKRLIEALIDAGKPVLGVCLGAQLIADVLGARTYPGPTPEVGWFRVETTAQARHDPLGAALPESFETFLWHADTFDLPAGAVHLARSNAFEHQGFVWKRVMALQFHLEVRPDWVRRIAIRDAARLTASNYVQPLEAILGKPETLYRANNALMDLLLDLWLRDQSDSAPHRQA
jgi:GMP synthase-like glutamine amidotransferase